MLQHKRKKKTHTQTQREKPNHPKNETTDLINTTDFTSASAVQRSHLFHLQGLGRDAQNPIPLTVIIFFISLVFTFFDVPSLIKENNDKHPLPFVETLAWLIYSFTGITAEKLAPLLVDLLKLLFPTESNTALTQDYLDPKLSVETAEKSIALITNDFQANTYYLATNIAISIGGYFLLTAGEKDSFCFQTGNTALELYATTKFINMLLSLINSGRLYFRNKSEKNIQPLKQILEVIKTDSRPAWQIMSHDKSAEQFQSIYSVITRSLPIIRSLYIKGQDQCFYSLTLNKEFLNIHFQHTKTMRRRISSDLFLLVLADIFSEGFRNLKIIAADNDNFVITLPLTQVISGEQGEDLLTQVKKRLAVILQKMQTAEINAKELNKIFNGKFILVYENKNTKQLTFSVEFTFNSTFIEREQKFMNALIEQLNRINGITTVLEKDLTGGTVFLIKNCSETTFSRQFMEEAKKTLLSTESTSQNTQTFHRAATDEHSVNDEVKIKKRPRWLLSGNSATTATSQSFWPQPISKKRMQPLSQEQTQERTITPPENFNGWIVHNENSHSLSLIKTPKAKSKINIEAINEIATIDCTDDTPGKIRMARSYGQDGLKKNTDSTFWLKDRNSGIRMLLEEGKNKKTLVNGNFQMVPCYRPIKLGHK
jgi:hypothetical protein